MSRQQIQGTQFWLERSRRTGLKEISEGNAEKVLANVIGVEAHEDKAVVSCDSMIGANPVEARLMATALQQAATIAADFETWWEQGQ